MGFNINEHQTNIVPFQSGSGIPNHLSPLGSVYVDNLTGIEYINKDGLNGWAFLYDSTMPIGGSSSGGTVTGATVFTGGLTANTISATTYLNLPSISGLYLPLSGGTLSGPLSGTTFSGTGLTLSTPSGLVTTGETFTLYNTLGQKGFRIYNDGTISNPGLSGYQPLYPAEYFGYGTPVTTASGLGNTVFGGYAMGSQTGSAAAYNTVFGVKALGTLTTGSMGLNCLFGMMAGYYQQTGSYNVGMGYNSLAGSTGITSTGTAISYNVGIGTSTLLQITNGAVGNTAIGNAAMQGTSALSGITGTYNTGIGFQSLFKIISGIDNVGLGAYSLQLLTTGSYNTGLGYASLNKVTTGSNNVGMGYSSLFDVTTGTSNTALGYNTGRGIITGSNNTILGASVTGLADISNTVIIADGQGNQRITVPSTGNVLIGYGLTDAGYKFDVNGTTRLNGKNTFTGSITASANLAQANLVTSTLVAAAHNDVLVGLDVTPTFNSGSYTGVTNYSARFSGGNLLINPSTTFGNNILFSGDNTSVIGSLTNRLANIYVRQISSGSNSLQINNATSVFINSATASGNIFSIFGNGNNAWGGNGDIQFINAYPVLTMSSNATPYTHTLLRLNPTYTYATGGNYSVRGIHYNPILSNTAGIISHIALETTTGNVILGSTSGNTIIGGSTDNLSKLQVSGTITASSGSAVGTSLYPTLTATAINDRLTGVEISNTFNDGGFTGVSKYGLRLWAGAIGPQYNMIFSSGLGKTNINAYNTNTANAPLSLQDISTGYLLLCIANNTNGVVIGTSSGDASSIFTVASTSKGALLPRTTYSLRTGITSPATGLLIYQTDTSTTPEGFYINKSGGWDMFGTLGATQTWSGVNKYETSSGGSLLFNSTTVNSGTSTIGFQNFGQSAKQAFVSGVPVGGQNIMNLSLGTNGTTELIQMNGQYLNTLINKPYLRDQVCISTTTNNSSVMLYFNNTISTNNTSLGASGIQSVTSGGQGSATRLEFLLNSGTNPTVVTGDRAMSIFHATKNVLIDNSTSDGGQTLQIGGTAKSSTAWGLNGIQSLFAATTYTDNSTAASATVSNNMVNVIGVPTLSATTTGVTYTNASTLYIAGPPIGSGVTITNPTALSVGSGRFTMNNPGNGTYSKEGQLLIATSSGAFGGFFVDTSGTGGNMGFKPTFGFKKGLDGLMGVGIQLVAATDYDNRLAFIGNHYQFTSSATAGGSGLVMGGQYIIPLGRIHSTGIYGTLNTVSSSFYSDCLSTAAANNQKLVSHYINDTYTASTFTGITTYGIYQNNAAQNYLQGNTGINTSVDAGYKLDVNGTSRNSGLSTFNGGILSSGNISSTAWGTNGVNLQVAAATYTDTSSSGSTSINNMVNTFGIPTINTTNTGVTYQQVATLYIAGVPVAANTGVTLQNTYSIYANGRVQINGSLGVTQGLTSNGNIFATGGNFIYGGTGYGTGYNFNGNTGTLGFYYGNSTNVFIGTTLTGFTGLNVNTSNNIGVGAISTNTAKLEVTGGILNIGTYGYVNINASNNQSMIVFSGGNTIGGTGYTDFIKVVNTSAGATNQNKTIRLNNTGGLEFLNSAYTSLILSISDNGILNIGGGAATTTSNDGAKNYLAFNSNNSQIYDDTNLHIHSRNVGGSMWLNTNGGQLNLLNQSPLGGGAIGTGVAIGNSTTLKAFTNIYGSKTYTIGAYGYTAVGGTGTGGGTTAPYSLYCDSRIEATEFDATSDERLKDVQGKIELTDAINLVKNIEPIIYTWKDSKDKSLKAGYSAQQVVKSGFKHLVSEIPNDKLAESTDEDGFTSPEGFQLTMNYDQVIPYHGTVIKYLLEKIELLEKELQEIKNK